MMETKYWDVTTNPMDHKTAINQAAELLTNGELVAFPTETVYGLGADATQNLAVAKIFQAKGRPQDNPLIAHVATVEQLRKLVDNLPDYAEKLLEAFTPGPLTFVLPSNGTCAENVTSGLATVAVRIPDHPVARRLLLESNVPIAAPSANLSGKPSPTTAQHVWDDLDGKIAGIVDGGPTGVGLESTVIDCTQDIPIILRPGGITREQMEEVLGEEVMNPAPVSTKAAEKQPKAPGMKYKHYSPEVPLWLVEGTLENIQHVINHEQDKGRRVGLLASNQKAGQLTADEKLALGETMDEIAAHLYDGLRTFKQGDVDLIICESFSEKGIGQAVMNRLKKAASKVQN